MTNQQTGADQQGARRWVGDARVVGRPLGRVLDALCYVVTGIVFVIMSRQEPDLRSAGLLGAAAAAYGTYIFLSDGRYWIGWWVYIFGAGGIVFALSTVLG